MGVLCDILRACGHLADPRLTGLVVRSIVLALGLLVALSLVVVWAVGLLPVSFSLPLVGEVGTPFAALRGLAVGGMALLSAMLMFPVAALFVNLFLDEVAEAVERRCYPGLEPARGAGLLAELRAGIGFAVVVVVVNLFALVVYLVAGPFGPVVFWAVNGYLFGREFFELVALRRLTRAEMRRLRRRHFAEIWLAGALIALLLSVPLAGLVAPMLGVATFVHTFHRLNGTALSAAMATGRDRSRRA